MAEGDGERCCIPNWRPLPDVDESPEPERSIKIDDPITGKELMNYARISNAYEDAGYDEGSFHQFKPDEDIKVVDGLLALSKHRGLGIAIEPVIEKTDTQSAVARIQLRRVRMVPGDTWDEMEP
jgi:hypothetical protein